MTTASPRVVFSRLAALLPIAPSFLTLATLAAAPSFAFVFLLLLSTRAWRLSQLPGARGRDGLAFGR